MIKFLKKRSDNFYLFHKYPIAKEFVKFCLVGFTNLFVDIIVYFILTRLFNLHYIIAAMGSFVLAVSWSFVINRYWTFRHQGRDVGNQYVKFLIANAFVMVLNLSLMYTLVDLLHVYDLLSKLIIAVILAFVNFTINKLWTFKTVKHDL
jgi:putative flippase GtrA